MPSTAVVSPLIDARNGAFYLVCGCGCRTSALTRTLLVTGLTEKRVGAPRVTEFLEDRTPDSERQAAKEKHDNARLYALDQGGRPTKKNRRDIERILGSDW